MHLLWRAPRSFFPVRAQTRGKIICVFFTDCQINVFILQTGTNLTKRKRTDDDLALVAVEGHGMAGVPGVAARTFTSLARVNVSAMMISLVVDQGDARRAVQAIHDAFIGGLNQADV